MSDTWGVQLLEENGDVLYSGPGQVEFRKDLPTVMLDLVPHDMEFIIRASPKDVFLGHCVYTAKVIKNNAYYAVKLFTDVERISNRGPHGGQYGQFGVMICECNLLQSKKTLICPCGIHRTDCDYHK